MIMLDTHALVWWREKNPRLSQHAKSAIAREAQGGSIAVSAFSFWEIALPIEHNRLVLTQDLASWVAAVEGINYMRSIPVDNQIAVASIQLPASLPKDPADRIIVATAIQLSIPIVTADHKMRAYQHVQTIW